MVGTVYRFLLICIALAASAAGANSPSVVHLVGLDYPRLAHLASVQGAVEFDLSIGPDGAVSSTKLVSGNGLLAEPVAETLKKWTFTACVGAASECIYRMSVVFVLDGGPLDISECKSNFEFDSSGRVTIRSQFARAIVN
jgi:hypothetical protein